MPERGEMPTPIGRGKEIKLERLLERVKALRESAEALYATALEQESLREAMLQAEIAQPFEKVNVDLVEILENEIDEIRAMQRTVFKEILSIAKDEEMVRGHWLDSIDETEAMLERLRSQQAELTANDNKKNVGP